MLRIILYLAVINALIIASYAYDKHAAKNRKWRIPEKSLFMLALAGGTPGAFYAARKFRHKTKKNSFRFVMALIVFAQIFALLFCFTGQKL